MVGVKRRKDDEIKLLVTLNTLSEDISPLLEEVQRAGMPRSVFLRKVTMRYAKNYPDVKRLIASLQK